MKQPDILLISLMNWSLCEIFISRFGAGDKAAYKKLAAITSEYQLATDLSKSGVIPVQYLGNILFGLLESKPFDTQNTRTALLLSLWVHAQVGHRLGNDQIEGIIRTLKFRKSTTEQKVAMLLTGLTA